MGKYCPILILTSVIGKTFGNVGSCYVVMEDKCIKEDCALWNEAQGRCGLVCTSQPEQPSRDMESVFNLNGLRQMTFKESRTKDCPQLVVFTKGAKTQISSSTYGKEWATYCAESDDLEEEKQHSGLLEE